MHDIEPYYGWEKYYVASNDEYSPFYGREYIITHYTQEIYGYYIHPMWDNIGSETLYIKILYVHYGEGFAIIELLGEWNDTLYNDVMYLKRNVIDLMINKGINKFILIGENILNFHGSDECYYEEWFEDVEDGWVVAINFRDFVLDEMSHYNIDWYINWGGSLDIANWRTFLPVKLYQIIKQQITFRLGE
ncbi:hypothetical protein V6R21_31280 [Limibacter armeniacum]|uniref:hypothetical protein n=1 Tax=Limibacter armeniacum TaxID=466084 RepID=UPI002FE6612D